MSGSSGKVGSVQPVVASARSSNREKDVETMYKNQYMKRMIHESLQSGNSVSMPDLRGNESLSQENYNERSVDEIDKAWAIDEIVTVQENFTGELLPDTGREKIVKTEANVLKAREVLNETVETLPEIREVLMESNREIPREDIFQKRVKFEEDFEIEEMKIERTQVLAYIENDYGENSRNFRQNMTDIDESSIDLRGNSTDIDEKSTDIHEIMNNESDFKESEDESVVTVEKIPPLRFISQTEGETMPPTPMKRKSRSSYFAQSSEDSQENFKESSVDVEQPPVIKPRTKRLVHRTSDVSKTEEFKPVETELLQEIIKLSDEKPEKLQREESLTSEVSEISEACETFPTPVVPKSILKTSETLSSPKTITFKNLPHAISESEDDSINPYVSSDSEEEEEDIWSQVHQHRFIMQSSRHKDLPPPLPKTPPPSAEDEKQFSFA